MPPKYGATGSDEDPRPASGSDRDTADPLAFLPAPAAGSAGSGGSAGPETGAAGRDVPGVGATTGSGEGSGIGSYGATDSPKDSKPKSPPTTKTTPLTAGRARWQRAVRKVTIRNRIHTILFEGDVTPHAAAAFMTYEAWGWQKGGVEMDGRLLSSTRSARKLYRLFHNYTWARRIPIAVLLILPLLELPGWCMDTSCENGLDSPSGWYVFLEPNAFHATELTCASCVLLETYGMLRMQGASWTVSGIRTMDRVIHAKIVVVLVLIVDCVVSWMFRKWFRLGGYLRIAIFVLTVPRVRKSVYNVAVIVPKFLSVAVLFVSYIFFGAWLSLAALGDTQESDTYGDLWSSVCLMMVLLTTANNPDAWLGAYHQNRGWGIFFLSYVCFGNFYLMSLLLATIYGVYKEQAMNTANGCERERAACLKEAFALLDVRGTGFVDGYNAKLFVEALNSHTDIPSVAPEHLPSLLAIFTPSDGEEDVNLAPAEFEVLVDQLNLKFGDIPNPALRRSGWGPVLGPLLFGRMKALSFVRTKAFGKFVTAMLVFNAVVVVVEWNKEAMGIDGSNDSGIYTLEGVFGFLYLTEMLLKWGGHSFFKYWRDPLNCYDGIITLLSTGVEIALIVPNQFDQLIWLKWLIVMRVLRLTRLLIKVRLFKVIISTFFELLPSLFPLLCAFGCIVSVYATYGVQQFGGLSYRGNPLLEGTSYASAEYYDLNLNDFPSAIVMLVCQCIVNNWFVVMDGYAAMTGSEWTRLYFFTFYFIATVFVLNLVIVVILDAAMAIIEADTAIVPDVQNLGDLDDDDDNRFAEEEEQIAKAREEEHEIAEGAAGKTGGEKEQKGLQRMLSGATGDQFVAPENTNKGKSQRAILDFRSKLVAVTTNDDSGDDDDDDISLASEMRGDRGRTAPSAEDSSPFDPNRTRLRGANTRVGRRVMSQQSVTRGYGGNLAAASVRNLARTSSSDGRSRGAARGRGRMSLLVDPDTDSE